MKEYYYKRSIESRIINKAILLLSAKSKFQKEEAFIRSLQKLEKNRKPYQLPKMYAKKTEENTFHGMKIYSFQGNIGNAGKKIILYIHGGAYVNEMYVFHLRMLDKLIQGQDLTILIPDYPLAPEYTYQKTYELISKLYQEILRTTEAKDIIFMGDSAGGGFILAFAEYLNTIQMPQPGNIIMLSPWLDLSLKNENIKKLEKKDMMLSTRGLLICGKAWAGELDLQDYRVSPLYGDLSNLGDITIFTGTNEIFNPDCHLLDELLDEMNINHNFFEYYGQGHVFPVYPIKETNIVINQILKVIYSED